MTELGRKALEWVRDMERGGVQPQFGPVTS